MTKLILHLIIVLLLLAGCKSRQTESRDAHEGEEFKIKITAYSADFELFAEADPFVAGQTSNVLSHFTHLPSFKALESGKITISLISGAKQVTQVLEKPTKKGIFSFDLKPEEPGQGKIIFDIETEDGKFAIITENITVYENADDANEAAEKDELSKTNTVVFTKEQSWKVDFATELPAKIPFGQIIKTTGLIVPSQGDEVIVPAKTDGIVVFHQSNLPEGSIIRNGQTLFTISGSGFADNNLQVRLIEAQNNFEKARADYERHQELAKEKVVSEKDLLATKNTFDNTKAIYDNLNLNFSTSGQTVKSPLSGFVKQLFVSNGQYIQTGQPLVTITQNRTLLVRADLQQKYANLLSSVVSANFVEPNSKQSYSLGELDGKILSLGKNTSNDNYTIPVTFQIANKGKFMAGSFVEVFLVTNGNSEVLTLPDSALLEEQGNFFVFVQLTPELFEKRQVTTGATDGRKTEIKSGISINDRIVTKGAILIKLAQSSGALDPHAGHVH